MASRFLMSTSIQVIHFYGSSLLCNLGSHFGQPVVETFNWGSALGPTNIAYSNIYHW